MYIILISPRQSCPAQGFKNRNQLDAVAPISGQGRINFIRNYCWEVNVNDSLIHRINVVEIKGGRNHDVYIRRRIKREKRFRPVCAILMSQTSTNKLVKHGATSQLSRRCIPSDSIGSTLHHWYLRGEKLAVT